MKNFAIGLVFGLSLSGTLWAIASGPSLPSTQGARPDQLWQQDRGAAIQGYLDQRQHDILQEHQFRRTQGDERLRHPC